jgi:hypothetical protein
MENYTEYVQQNLRTLHPMLEVLLSLPSFGCHLSVTASIRSNGYRPKGDLHFKYHALQSIRLSRMNPFMPHMHCV